MRYAALAYLFFILLLIFGFADIPVASADTTANATTVNVSVLSISSLTITPINLTWPILVPGNTNFTYNIIVKNTGTVQLSKFYMTPSTLWDEPGNPLNQNDPHLFASSGFIFVRNASNLTGGGSGITGAAPKAFHVGRIEWNLTDIMVDEVLSLGAGITNSPGVAAPHNTKFGHGWYRNATGNELLWKVENGTRGWCNNSDTILAIKDDPENTSSQSRDFSLGVVLTPGSGLTFDAANRNWSIWSVNSGELDGYCIAVNASCDFIYLYKYDMAGMGWDAFPTCSQQAYLRSDILNPGEEFTMSLDAAMPKGVPAGYTAISRLTITADVGA